MGNRANPWKLKILALIIPCLTVFSCSKSGGNQQNFTIAIDIGHTLKRPGATSARGRGEFSFNREIAGRLLGVLHEEGFTRSFLINEGGDDIGLADRTMAALEKKADLFISLHHDAAQPRYLRTWEFQGKPQFYVDSIRGFSLFYSELNADPAGSLAFAELLGSEMRRSGFSATLHHAEPIEGENRNLIDEYRGIYRFDSLGVLKSAKMPAVLVECGVILNREEELLLSDPAYQKTIVRAIVRAVNQFIKI